MVYRHLDATDCSGNTQLPTVERNNAHDIQTFHRKDSGGMETDIQGTTGIIATYKID